MVNSDTEPLSRDKAFDILSNRRRRYALHYLSNNPEGVTLQTLAKQIAAWENDTSVESLTKKQQKRVYVSLYQTHIPKLEEVGIVDHDQDTGVITLTSRAGDVTSYLRSDRSTRDEWYRYYIGLVALSTVVFALTVFDVSVFAAVSPTVVGVVILLGFALLTGVYVLTRYREPDTGIEDFGS